MVARPPTFNIPMAPIPGHYQPQPQPPHQQQQPPQQQQQQQQRTAAAQVNRSFYSQDPADAQSRMQESLKRSITLVFWYKVSQFLILAHVRCVRALRFCSTCYASAQAGNEPIRLHQEITTFPLFSLSQFTQLVSDLGMQPHNYVDAFNPQAGTWEQQTLTAVRVVESEQRLLFRIRTSLLEGLADRDCPGLDSEIRMQNHGTQTSLVMSPTQKSLKRPMPDTSSDVAGPATKQFRTSVQSPFLMNQNNVSGQGFPQNTPAAAGPSSSPLANPHVHPSMSPAIHPGSPFARHDEPMPQVNEPPLNDAMITDENSLHPPAKRWPNDYAVCEISVGFDKMDELINQTPSLTQKAAFERVFGCRYVKSTVCRHRGVWRRADKNLKESFKRMGKDDRALWGEFVKKTDFRREGQKPKSQHDRDDDHMPAMDYAMSSVGALELNLVSGMMGRMTDGMTDDPPMASLGPPPG